MALQKENDCEKSENYNAETVIALREFPHIRMALRDIFENVVDPSED